MPIASARTTPLSQASLLRRMLVQAQELKQGGNRFSIAEDDDSFIQAVVCAAPIIAAAAANAPRALDWLRGQLSPWEKSALDQAAAFCRVGFVHHYSTTRAVGSAYPTAHLYEHFLHRIAPTSRKRRGVFFTPQPIADYIVAAADRLLCNDCGVSGGLAGAPVHIIDPACGTGVFVLAVIERLRRTFANRRDWIDCVNGLLPRLTGIEILPAAAFLAKLNIVLKLAETGYEFERPGLIRVITGDALASNLHSEICNLNSEIPVVLGNPPFSSLSTTTNPWIAQLVRGDDQVRGYIRANGQQLKERKTWLHDDYVKFIRLAQWHVEQAGCGIIGFVTNHGYLDNATFRLMRHELLRVFERVQILDLHGNRKKHEVPPDGSRDENVFGLDQGVAIGLFCRPPQTLARSASEGIAGCQANYAEIWGSRSQKLQALVDATNDTVSINCERRLPSLALRASVLKPQSPHWGLIPAPPVTRHAEYENAWSLAEAMPVNTTAPVTARDHFVVAFTQEELERRIEQFRDLSIPDDEIRRRYFQRTRSARYERGDTRGWKLAEARRIVAADDHWRRHIIRCLYRPFDWRFVFWHPAMIDWPRHEVTRYLLGNESSKFQVQSSRLGNTTLNLELGTLNYCLIARRQQLPGHPCTFFWIADGLALDGVIRSDNRGSESLFPLYVDGRGNFAPAFVESFTAALRLAWQPLGRGDLLTTFGPEDLLAYIYALFHSPTYRERYADALRRDFPRILFPRESKRFKQFCHRGRELIDFHTLRVPAPTPQPPSPQPPVCSFRAGGYVALRKWLQPKHRSSADAQYAHIVHAISRTLEIMRSIDDALRKTGA